MKRVFCLVVLLALLPACDDACGPRPLAQLCGSGCPEDQASAIRAVCEHDGGSWSDEWLEAENSCGGTNIESGSTSTSIAYSFDSAGKLVGGLRTSDTNSGKCSSFDTFYGKRCDARKSKTHDCPTQP
jgi:hypothetical protein